MYGEFVHLWVSNYFVKGGVMTQMTTAKETTSWSCHSVDFLQDWRLFISNREFLDFVNRVESRYYKWIFPSFQKNTVYTHTLRTNLCLKYKNKYPVVMMSWSCRVATSHGLHRGWLTYGDLCTLLDNSGFLHTLGVFKFEVLKVSASFNILKIPDRIDSLKILHLCWSPPFSLGKRVFRSDFGTSLKCTWKWYIYM